MDDCNTLACLVSNWRWTKPSAARFGKSVSVGSSVHEPPIKAPEMSQIMKNGRKICSGGPHIFRAFEFCGCFLAVIFFLYIIKVIIVG